MREMLLRFDLCIPMQSTATPNNRIPQRSVQLHSTIVGALSMMHRLPFMHTCPADIIHWACCNAQFLSLQFSTFTLVKFANYWSWTPSLESYCTTEKHARFLEQTPEQYLHCFFKHGQLFTIKIMLYGAS